MMMMMMMMMMIGGAYNFTSLLEHTRYFGIAASCNS
jgi:hypothetical protein